MSQTSIMNQALDLLEEEPIIDPSDDRAAVRWMNRNYGPVRDSLLRLHPWNFATARIKLPREDATPVSAWKYQFVLPPDCLRVLPLEECGDFNGASVVYRIEGRRIVTNSSMTPLPVTYIARIEDTTMMDALFVQVLSATLAYRSAHWFTGKQSMATAMQQQARDLLTQAQLIDSLEGTPDTPEADDWINGRITGVI